MERDNKQRKEVSIEYILVLIPTAFNVNECPELRLQDYP